MPRFSLMIDDNGKQRELVRVAHAVVKGNPDGFVEMYRDQMQAHHVEYDADAVSEAKATQVQEPRTRRR